MRPFLLQLVLATALALGTYGQTITTTNALGLTVVEVVTLNPLGIVTTQTLSTLTGEIESTTSTISPTTTALTTTRTRAPTTTSTSTSTSTTTTQQGGGVVGQSPTEAAAEQTVYQYSTTNAAGETIVLTATFTPTFAPTTTPTPTNSGTILNYSQWLSSAVGTATTVVTSAAPHLAIPSVLGSLSSIAAILAGSVLVFA